MKFTTPLVPGILVQRYKRFLADIRLDSGEIITAHCPNSGSMKSCNIPGNKVLLSFHDSIKRKYKYTWEMIQIHGNWVGINTQHPNHLVEEALKQEQIQNLTGYPNLKREVKIGQNSRIDLVLENSFHKVYIEVKNVTLVEDSQARFPDAITERGHKHLRELMKIVKGGERAVMFYVIQREDANSFSTADDIDPVYGQLLRAAEKEGVEILAYQARVTPRNISIHRSLPVLL